PVLVLTDQFLQCDVYPWQGARDPIEHLAEDRVRPDRSESEPEDPGLTRGHATGSLRSGFDECKDPPRLRQEHLTSGRQGHTPAAAIEQTCLQEALERLDLTGQWRLGHVQPLGRASVVQLLGNGDEASQL